MAYDVVATRTFEREYDSIIGYHANVLKSPGAARRLMEDVAKVRVSLAENPLLSAVSRKSALEGLKLREKLVRNCVIVYKVDGDCVYLEHIFHQSQDFERLV